ncbi:unnamed protein product [Spirodela intermedia]|uniref:Uncharacterized protein n=1 Tax=Spirodela intermedia TaxID=51605 RepID=A0A7I8IEZ9_SPIIN|nr:unnamed protein product [Spirodela intermedia]CAA6656191.1 unnamed protein product [Spirodela intermedia]
MVSPSPSSRCLAGFSPSRVFNPRGFSLLAGGLSEQCSRQQRWDSAVAGDANGEKFFNPCLVHAGARKNERNVFCLDCCTSFCPTVSLPTHLIIRRYVYQDVVRVDDLGKLIDCEFVQSYTTNSAKVVFISERPQTRPFRASANICISCDRSLQEPYLFCCLSCKEEAEQRGGSAPPPRPAPVSLCAEPPSRRKGVPNRSPLY